MLKIESSTFMIKEWAIKISRSIFRLQLRLLSYFGCYECLVVQWRDRVSACTIMREWLIDPLYAFLFGGESVGKGALYQALLKYYSHRIHENPDNKHVMLCAPTGKAAHNINGTTLHSAFCIPVGRGFAYKPLDMQQLNTLRTKFISLKVIFIDEISMVGHNMFNFINLRLQEIKGCT